MGPIAGRITAGDLADLAGRQVALTNELARARREPDRKAAATFQEIALDPDLAQRLIAAADAAGEDPTQATLPPQFAGEVTAALKASIKAEAKPTTTGAAEARAQALVGRANFLKKALVTNNHEMADDILGVVVRHHGIDIAPDLLPFARRAVLGALVPVFEAERGRELGHYPAADSDPVLTMDVGFTRSPVACMHPAAAPQPDAATQTPLAVNPPTEVSGDQKSKPRPTELLDAFFAERTTQGDVLAHTIDQERGTMARFIEVNGDRPVDRYGRGDATTFLAKMRQVPKHYGKSPADRMKSLDVMIAEANTNGAERLKDKTLKRHFSCLRGFFTYCANKGHISLAQVDEITSRHKFKLGPAREARDQWTSHELRALFTSPVWMGRDERVQSRPGPYIIRDSLFWLPPLELYHGNRLEEFADARRTDVRRQDGVWIIDVTDEHRTLKNGNAKRPVPLHPELIRMGFLEYVAVTAPSPTDPLFPDLAPQGKDMKRGPRLTRRFSNYRKTIGIYREGISNHALRHSLITRMQDTITDHQQDRHLHFYTGHQLGTSEGKIRYDKGPNLVAGAATMALARFPEIDLSHLYVREAGDISPPQGW